MKIVELIRLEEDDRSGTFGVLKIDKKAFCVTLEPCDRLNAPNVSSIPAQQYICARYESSRYGSCFIVKNVPKRIGILFHSGNLVGHTEGCILLGQYFGKLRDNRAVLNSGETFTKFMKVMENEDEFHLTVREIY